MRHAIHGGRVGQVRSGNNQLRLLYVRRVVRLVVTGIVIREGSLASVSVLEERRPGKRVVVQVRVPGQVSIDVVLVLRNGELTVIEIVCELRTVPESIRNVSQERICVSTWRVRNVRP